MKKITSLLTLLFFLVGGVNVWGQLPQGLELTTDLNNPIYYYIKSVRTNTNRNIFLRSNDDNSIERVANAETAGIYGYWYFMAGTTDGTVKIYNLNGKALASNSQVADQGMDWFIKENAFVNGAFTISKNANVNSGGHCLDAKNTGSGIGYWNSTKNDNEGTAWNIEKAQNTPNFAQEIINLSATVNNETLINGQMDASYVGFMDNAKKESLKNALTAAEGKSSFNDYETLKTAISTIMAPTFDEGAYYLIEHQNPRGNQKYPSTQHMHSNTDGAFGTENNNDRVIRRVTGSAPLLPRLWKLEKQNNGGYKIRNANTGCVWSVYVNNGIDMPIDPKAGGTYDIQFVPCNAKTGGLSAFNTIFTLKIDGKMINAFQGDTPASILSDYQGNHIGDEGNHWSFKKVSEVPVTIGVAGWASVCMPFAVSLPAEVKAYIATAANGNVITLQEVSGVIPANTGVLLTGTQGEHKLTITTVAATANFADNLLKGANTKRLGFANGETYGLSTNTNNAPVFKKNGLNKDTKGYVPANKAYILSSDLNGTAQGASVLSIEFGGATTGIEGVEAEDTKNVIYFDLNGRRVLNPSNGVFVTNTGKKVFIR